MNITPRIRLATILVCAAVLTPPALAQNDEPNDAGWAEQQTPVFSLNVSPRLLAQGIDLLVEKRLTRDYNLDEFQAEEMRQLLRREIPKFMQEHQAELETLASEWLEAVSGSEPPTAEFAAEWAGRLRPIVEETSQMVEHLGDGMREFLDDDQIVLLDGYLAGAEMATKRINGQLYDFEQGRFDPEKHWPGNRAVRRRAPEDVRSIETQMARARNEALGLPAEEDPPSVVQEQPRSIPPAAADANDQSGADASKYKMAQDENIVEEDAGSAPPPPHRRNDEPAAKTAAAKKTPKHEWEIYVEKFIVKYKLNDEQQQKARQHLLRAMAQRETHLKRNGARMERITRMFEIAKTDKQRQTAEKAYNELHRPLNRFFNKLKDRLDTLPTRQQRRAAALPES